MESRVRILILSALLIFGFSCSQSAIKKSESQKPNVIFFIVDDLGWTDTGIYGSDLYQTPNVDRLAASGMRFSNAYSACTVCSPSRASILTGKYPARIHCTDFISGHKRPFAKLKVPDWTMYMDTTEYNLAKALKDNGYQTVHIGKWHLGDDPVYWPKKQGFDLNIGGYEAGAPKKGNGANGYFSPYNNPRLKDGNKGEYLTERLANEAVSYISQNKDKPFFINLWLYNVHTPLQAKEEKIQKYQSLIKPELRHKNATYAAMVEHMDDALGKVLESLEKNGLRDNTILLFSSDNGGLIRKENRITDNSPLKSGKGDVYEGGVRVPLIVSWPPKIQANQMVDDVVISLDFYPTILSLLGIENSKQQLDGVDISPVLLNEKSIDRESIYWHYPHYHRQGATPYSAVRNGDWKLIYLYENDSVMLFNLADDIGESHNIANKNPEKKQELWHDLQAWLKRVDAQYPLDNPKFDPKKESLFSNKNHHITQNGE